MAYGQRAKFTNPLTGSSTSFQINPTEEQAMEKVRNIQHTAPTGGLGLVKQQGDDSPLLIGFSGILQRKTDLQAFLTWEELTRTQTIYYEDFAEDKYEVIVTSFKWTRKRTAWNPRDSSIPRHYYAYEMELEVVRIISGVLSGLVTP